MSRYYVLVIKGGTEITRHGPFFSTSVRDDRARELFRLLDPVADNVFRADCVGEQLQVSEYLSGEMA